MRALLVLPLFLLAGAQAQTGDAERARLLDERAIQAYHRGDQAGLREAIRFWAEAARLYARLEQHPAVATRLSNIGQLHGALGRPDSALVYYRRSLAIWREVGDRSAEGATLRNVGGVYQDLGRPDSALVYYTRSLAIQREGPTPIAPSAPSGPSVVDTSPSCRYLQPLQLASWTPRLSPLRPPSLKRSRRRLAGW
jgi:tetratricopeptide (TPR) repeat protein